MATGDEDTLNKYQPRPTRQHPRAMWLGAAAAGFVLVGVVLGVVFWGPKGASVPALQAVSPPTPARPRHVRIDLDSVPRGATVTSAESGQLVGTTPTTLSLEASPSPRQFVFRLQGHEAVTQTVAIASDTRVLVSLARSPDTDASDGPRRRSRRPGLRRGTLNPYAE